MKWFPSYLFWWLVQSAGIHSQYGIPGAQKQDAWWAVQKEGTKVGHTLELIWTNNDCICGPKEDREGRRWARDKRSQCRLQALKRKNKWDKWSTGFPERALKRWRDEGGREMRVTLVSPCRLTPLIPLGLHHSFRSKTNISGNLSYFHPSALFCYM